MKKETFAGLFIAILSEILLLSPMPARGAATVYWTFDNGFQPATVVIGPGGKVTWWNVDYYNLDTWVYFDGGFNFQLPNAQGMQVTFPSQTGDYGYSDQIGDRGSVIVNVAPTVAINSPPDNSVFPAPATFPAAATANDTADDAVSDVEFFLGTKDGTNSIEDVFTPPYTTGLTNLDAGTYTLLAVARDSRGWTATNSITITVTGTGPVNLSSPRMVANKLLFEATGLAVGRTNIVQISTNLASWSPVATNVAAGTSLTVTNNPASTRQFYRVVQLP